jgi:hypothetical protein
MLRFLFLLLSTSFAAVPSLQVKTVRYTTSGKVPAVGIYVTNMGLQPVDSLNLRIFVRSKDTVGTREVLPPPWNLSPTVLFPEAISAKYDICQKFDAAGFNKPCDPGWSGITWNALYRSTISLQAKAVGEPDASGVRDWAFDLPIGPIVLGPAESFRFDVVLADRSQYPNLFRPSNDSILRLVRPFLPPDRVLPTVGDTGYWDHDGNSNYDPGLEHSWSFLGSASVPGQLDVDSKIRLVPINSHVVVYSRRVPVWGEAPDGSAPGLAVPPPSPDVGRVLPYAAIAARLPVDGNVAPLDSAVARPSRVRVNQAGYRLQDVSAGRGRIRYYGSGSTFALHSDKGAVVAGGALSTLGFQQGTRLKVCHQGPSVSLISVCKLDTDTLGTSIPRGPVQEGVLPTGLSAGRWRAIVGTDTSAWFQVSDSVYGWVRDAAVRFLGIQRSGDSSWFHGPSHMQDGLLDGAPGAYVGGWYDAGDHLKEPVTMASALATLATLSATQPRRDVDRWGAIHRSDLPLDGVPDVLKEARFGARFFLDSWTRNGRQVGADTLGNKGMVTGIGDFGKDHGYWGPPELQDEIIASGRGGRNERTVRREMGTDLAGDLAAALAMLSVKWRPYDAAWSDTALQAARSLYDWAKVHPITTAPSPSYNGAVPNTATLALAATALLWATRDSGYLKDLVYDKTLGSKGQVNLFPQGSFEGGWMVWKDWNLLKMGANADWANRHALALYAFARLILLDAETAASCGVRDEAERALLLRRTVAGMQDNLLSISTGSAKAFDLPVLDPNRGSGSVGVSPDWNMQLIQTEWMAPGYVAANVLEVLLYADVARDLRAGKGGASLASLAWPVEGATSLAVRQLDWILGLNRWDVSFVGGIGAKNFSSAHHRAANPEGSNWFMNYPYRTPVGAMWGFPPSDTGKSRVDWAEYKNSEVTLAGAATLLAATHLLAPEVGSGPVGVGTRRLQALQLSALARSRRIQASVSGAQSGELMHLEVLDASGRRVAQLEAAADPSGRLQTRLPPVSRGVAILRVRTSSGLQQVRTVLVP